VGREAVGPHKREAGGLLLGERAGWATRRIWAAAGFKEEKREREIEGESLRGFSELVCF
jgi:hypothetical protein